MKEFSVSTSDGPVVFTLFEDGTIQVLNEDKPFTFGIDATGVAMLRTLLAALPEPPKEIFYITASNGDGSFRTEFYDSRECIEFLRDEANGREDYWDGDGVSWGSFTAPGGILFDAGRTIMTMSDLRP